MTATQKLITDFFSADANVRFYKSSVDGTPCVEWHEFCQIKTATEVNLAKRIMNFKRERLRRAKAA